MKKKYSFLGLLLGCCLLATSTMLYAQSDSDTGGFMNPQAAASDFQSLMQSLNSRDHGNAYPCSLPPDESKKYSCLGEDFLPPFPSGFPSNYSWKNGTNAWVPLSYVDDGQALLAILRNHASQASPFDCGTTCRVVLRDIGPDGRTPYLFLCDVPRVRDQVGAPEKCISIEFEDGANIWMRALGKHGGACWLCDLTAMMGAPDFDITVVGPNIPIQQLVRATQEGLAAQPLLLDSVLVNSVVPNPQSLMAVSDRRESRFLAGRFREWITVRADVYAAHRPPTGSGPLRSLVEISTNLLVNRRPTSDESEWHPPTTDQNQQFLRTVRENIKRAVSGLCPNGVWQDSLTLNCAE